MKLGFKIGLVYAFWSIPVGAIGVVCMIIPPVGLCILWAAAYPVARILAEHHREQVRQVAMDEPLKEEGHIVKPWDVSVVADIDDAEMWDIIEREGGRNA